MPYSTGGGSRGRNSNGHYGQCNDDNDDDGYPDEPYNCEYPDDNYFDERGKPHRHLGREGWLVNSQAVERHTRPDQRRRGRSADTASTSWRPLQRRHRGYSDKDGGQQHGMVNERWAGATEAAVGAAAVEMLRLRKEPRPASWKGVRIATAALAAATVETIVDKRGAADRRRTNKWLVAESVVAGLLVNRVVNGPRRKPRY